MISEAWIGEWLASKSSTVRDAITIETKTFNQMESGQDHGLSRARIRRQIDTSLRRLGVERVALYMAHAPDEDTPHEETLRACDELVQAGKVGAVGASNFDAEHLAEAVEISELEGLTRNEWVQNSLSLLERADAETVFPVCHEHGLGYEAFGPLAGGWLTGKYRRGAAYPEVSRMTQRPDSYLRYSNDVVFDALEAFEREALGRGVSMAGLRSHSRRFWYAYREPSNWPHLAQLHATLMNRVAEADETGAGAAVDELIDCLEEFTRTVVEAI